MTRIRIITVFGEGKVVSKVAVVAGMFDTHNGVDSLFYKVLWVEGAEKSMEQIRWLVKVSQT